MKKWVFAAGAGLGYILGTRAGREQYERMRAQAKEFLDKPTVKEATGAVQAEATRLLDEGKAKVKEKVRQLNDRTSGTDSDVTAAEPTVVYPAVAPIAPPSAN